MTFAVRSLVTPAISDTLPSDTAESTIAVGDRIHFKPMHIDPTINLHDVMYAVEGDKVVEVWPIAARGYRSG